jgi:hypothetical protein
MSGERTAFIAEDVDFDERGPVATGLFSGSVQTDEGGIEDAIDRDLALADAVRWGRERAGQVVVRIAGEEPELDTAIDVSRELRRRRPAGWEFLDRKSTDRPIVWDVVVEMKKATPPYGPPNPDGTWAGHSTVPHSIVQVEAAGYADALVAAVGDAPELIATRAFPTGSEAARVNARLDANGILF